MPRLKVKEDHLFEPNSIRKNVKQHYDFIPYETRVQMVQRIKNQGYSIIEAARSLNIRYSTAKYIYKCYKKNGKILKKTLKKVQSLDLTSEEYKGKLNACLKENQQDKSFQKISEEDLSQQKIQNRSYKDIQYQLGFNFYQMFVKIQIIEYNNYFTNLPALEKYFYY